MALLAHQISNRDTTAFGIDPYRARPPLAWAGCYRRFRGPGGLRPPLYTIKKRHDEPIWMILPDDLLSEEQICTPVTIARRRP